MNEKMKSLFEDLGKPTLRGIRKCPKCGTFNGTRGLTCKNKSCDVVFKESKDKAKSNGEAIKIITGSESQIYSVKIQDHSPDIRGFVQLPVVEGLSFLHPTPEIELIIQSAAQCYVDSCQKSDEDFSDLTLSVNTCKHVSSALTSTREAKPMTLKNSVLNAMPITNEMKQEIWKLATETTGPLVQRISKNCMVVKCKLDDTHRLGFLHLYFYNRHKRESSSKFRVVCDCETPELSKPRSWKADSRCIHFYACTCAFASDKKLSKEFKSFLIIGKVEKPVNLNLFGAELKRKISVLESDANDADMIQKTLLVDDVSLAKKRKENVSGSNADLMILPDGDCDSWVTGDSSSRNSNISAGKKTTSFPIDEGTVKLSFTSWLASVTERINQTMHFQFSGKPEPLVFHAPQMFFDCLQQRISAGTKKKRLPNSTSTFERKDALPLGKFSKFTWHINNLQHVKQIFDTAQTPLQVTRSFVENHDGTYDPYEPTSTGDQLAEHYKKISNSPLIKPLELKTFLKVGQWTPELKDPSPFIIEWIPNILPKSNIGELHVKFEYGHMRNGRVEVPPGSRSVVFIQRLAK